VAFDRDAVREPGGYGILCYTDAADEALGILSDLRRHGDCRVIVVALDPDTTRTTATWRFIHAGAADVMAWEDAADLACRIQARIERWKEVENLSDEILAEGWLVGESEAWRTLLGTIVEAARFTSTAILITGESGTGKELVARLIHRLSRQAAPGRERREQVTVDCSTIVPELSGSELFGHERGAFTGAVNPRDGAFALADGATLFLDEIGELPLMLQPQLLRAVQEKTYKRVGGNAWQTTNFRLVCATNRDLRELVKTGEFRLDLYYRIAGWVFHLPPLRERKQDIVPLACSFLRTALEAPPELDPPVREYLMNRSYSGNIRELRQLIQRIAWRHVGPGPITVGDIPKEDRPPDGEVPRAWPDERLDLTIADAVAAGASLKEINQTAAETAIRMAVQSERGNLQKAAKRLGVTDRALQMRRARAAGAGFD
jgi:transcriptional regulator with GAF, ATPase, and Fis domain